MSDDIDAGKLNDVPGLAAEVGTNQDNNIGYKRPPRHAQFKPGQSGNPRRPAKGPPLF